MVCQARCRASLVFPLLCQAVPVFLQNIQEWNCRLANDTLHFTFLFPHSKRSNLSIQAFCSQCRYIFLNSHFLLSEALEYHCSYICFYLQITHISSASLTSVFQVVEVSSQYHGTLSRNGTRHITNSCRHFVVCVCCMHAHLNRQQLLILFLSKFYYLYA